MPYDTCEGEGVVVEVGEENALADVLEAVGDDGEVDELGVFGRDDRNHSGPIFHEFSVFWPPIFEVGIVYIT